MNSSERRFISVLQISQMYELIVRLTLVDIANRQNR
jgi:hypothetical protein